jgi:hypothetical protein
VDPSSEHPAHAASLTLTLSLFLYERSEQFLQFVPRSSREKMIRLSINGFIQVCKQVLAVRQQDNDLRWSADYNRLLDQIGIVPDLNESWQDKIDLFENRRLALEVISHAIGEAYRALGNMVDRAVGEVRACHSYVSIPHTIKNKF